MRNFRCAWQEQALTHTQLVLLMLDANCEHRAHTQLVFKDGESFLCFIVLAIKHTNVFVVCIFTIWIWRAQHGIILCECSFALFTYKSSFTPNRWKTYKWVKMRFSRWHSCVCGCVGMFFLHHLHLPFCCYCCVCVGGTARSVDVPIFRRRFCKAFRMCKWHVRRRRIVEHTIWHMSL